MRELRKLMSWRDAYPMLGAADLLELTFLPAAEMCLYS